MEFNNKEKPLVVGLNNKIQELQIKKTYFYEMPTGKIEAVEAKEAWELRKKGFKQIGVSNGQTYAKAIRESQKLFKERGLESAQERLRKGFEEELECARGHFEIPPSNDVFGNGIQEFQQTMGKFAR